MSTRTTTPTQFRALADVSSFRQMAAGMWGRPRDPSIYGTIDLDAGPALRFLAGTSATSPVKLTVTHLVARAVALAIREQPEINAKVRFWGKLEQRTSVDVFVTVSTDGGRDLSGARIDRADERSLVEIAGEIAGRARGIRDGADKSYAKSRTLFRRLPWWLAGPTSRVTDLLVNELHVDLSGQGMPRDPFGSAMVTSVGMFGIDTAFAPFVPLARCPILILVPELRRRAWIDDGGDRVEIRPVLRLCATFDHRLVDGYQAGRMARTLTRLFATPELLL
jgi:pyruvate/2-oxoglutarate dehydrogenase complex dihydrolipoamide acyltransferase (E2) component